MKKPMTRRHFLTQMTAAGGAALLGTTAAEAALITKPHSPKKATSRKPYLPSPAEQQENTLRQAAYETLVRQPILKLSLDPHWFSSNTHFWYRNEGVGSTREFVLVNAAHGVRTMAFDHQRLAAGLTKASGKLCEANKLPFDRIAYTADLTAVEFEAAGKAWKCDLASYVCTRVDAVVAEKPRALKPDNPGAPAESGPKSPDGRWTARVSDNTIWVRDGGGAESALTHAGEAAHPFGEQRWSPDSKTLAVFQIDAALVKSVYMVESSPANGGTRGVLHSHPYAQPGDKNTTYALWLCNPATKSVVPAQIEPNDFGDVPDLQWSADGHMVFYEKTDRGHQRFRVIAVDTRTGQTRSVIDERAKTFINTSNSYTYYPKSAGEIIYLSEQDGWRHLYLYDTQLGTLKNRITQGPWVVREVERVDEDTRQIWFQASGRNPGQDPYLIHHYRVNFDGTGLVALTEGNGRHSLQYAPDRSSFVDTYSRADSPPVHELRRTSDGALLCALETADISALTGSGWKAPEVFRAKGRDGVTDIWGLVFRPSNLDPALSYPILENIYAGPQDSFVRKTFAVRDEMQSLADLGFIVVQCDGMGTRNRSKAFHDVCWRNLKDGGLPDRIAWISALAQTYPYCDTRRVGIYGVSAGGQSAAGALLFHPEFYKVAVASCGCHDNRIDKQWWNEQWMGYPVGPWYADSSNITHAANLRGKLLLLVGELDSNVPPESTLRLADHLIKAGKDFDLLVLPGLDHTSGGSYGERRRRDYFLRHLLGVEPPDRNVPVPLITAVPLAAHPASEEHMLSGEGGEETTIHFHNGSGQVVELFWLSGGKRVLYGKVAKGADREMHTYAGHAWLVMGADGIAREIFVGDPRPGIAEIKP